MDFKTHREDDDGDGQLAEINIVPMVDVMLVLLIIFMVAAPLSIGGINVDLPSSQARGRSIQEDRVILSINQQGQYFIEKMEVPAAALEARLQAIYQHRQQRELYIRADKDVVYSKVIDAMSAARMAGVAKISMLTQPKKVTAR